MVWRGSAVRSAVQGCREPSAKDGKGELFTRRSMVETIGGHEGVPPEGCCGLAHLRRESGYRSAQAVP